MKTITSLLLKRGLLTMLLFLTYSCGEVAKDTSTDGDTKTDDVAEEGETTFAVTGSLALSSGLSLDYDALSLNAGEIIKATYASADEDSGTLGADGSYNLTVKQGLPFALTVFSGASPVCSFMFPMGDNVVGSMEPKSDMNFGSITCVDGQAVVPEEIVSGVVKDEFKESVKNGEIDPEMRETLLDEKGLTVIMLSGFDARRGPDGGPGGPGDGPGGPGGQGPRLAIYQGHDHGPGGPGGGPGGPGGGPRGPGGGPGGPGGPDGFQPIDPKLCRQQGYSVPDFFVNQYEFNQQEGGEGDREGGQSGPTLFFVAKEDGLFDMIVREEDEQNGGEKDEIFSNIKLGGVGKEFAMVGVTQVSGESIKSEGAEYVLRDILHKFNTGEAPPPTIRWDESRMFCDPRGIAENILGQLGFKGYDDISWGEHKVPTAQSIFGWTSKQDNIHFPDHLTQKPLCSALTDDASAQLTVDEFCFELDTDGSKKLVSQTVQAAKFFCSAANNNLGVNYHNARILDENGDKVKACAQESGSEDGGDWQRTWLTDKTQQECEDLNIAAHKENEKIRQAGDTSVPQTWYNWMDLRSEMYTDCSNLRLAGFDLQACSWSYNDVLEPTYQPPEWDVLKTPENWWPKRGVDPISLLEADAKILDAQTEQGNNRSPMDHIRENIEMCIKDFERSERELKVRVASLENLNIAVDLINSTTNEDGTKKYIKETVEKFQRHGDFSFTSASLTSLSKQLDLATTRLEEWTKSIQLIKSTYAVLSEATFKVEADESRKCLPDALTAEKFKLTYQAFGDSFDQLSTAQKAALNHFECMNMDKNIRSINDFGLSAPIQGIKDINKETTKEDLASQFLTQECEGHFDHRGRCIEQISCQFPSGSETYIPFSSLLDRAELSASCSEIEEKVAMLGRELSIEQSRSGKKLPAGSLVAKVQLMTAMPEEECTITYKIPKMDDNGCFVYQDASGQSWADLEDTSTADASTFSLAFDDLKSNVDNLTQREIFEVLLHPNSKGEIGAPPEDDKSGGDEFDDIFAE